MTIFRIFEGEEGDPFFSIALFYGIRAIVQGIFTFKYITGTYWEYPGFPSFVVPYGDACDFYYSGHTGFLSLLSLYYWNFGYKLFAVLVAGFCLFVIQVLISFRIHYTIGKIRIC